MTVQGAVERRDRGLVGRVESVGAYLRVRTVYLKQEASARAAISSLVNDTRSH